MLKERRCLTCGETDEEKFSGGRKTLCQSCEYEQIYGISHKQRTTMLIQQNYVCAICGRPSSDRRPLRTDHNHVTGKVRGLLCGRCNVGLGMFQDNVDRLQRAIEYLEKDG